MPICTECLNDIKPGEDFNAGGFHNPSGYAHAGNAESLCERQAQASHYVEDYYTDN